MRLVDLAGSERLKKTMAEGERKKEVRRGKGRGRGGGDIQSLVGRESRLTKDCMHWGR